MKFDARAWAALAKNAGMKYIVITAKHHDGFAMYGSHVSGYNIVDATPFKRDPLKELAAACAEAGIKFCVYYSHREDWDHPYAYGNTWDYRTSQSSLDTMDHPELFQRYLAEKSLPQVRELLTGYGPLGIVWFDRGMYTQEQGKEFADLVHTLQPGCLVNGRVGHYDQELLGDYQSLTDNGMPPGGIEEYWETPQTLNDTWGYSRLDQNWKTPAVVVRKLVTIVSKGGNYLLNVGPTGEGVIPEASVQILESVGAWVRSNGESIYGAVASPFPADPAWGTCTSKPGRLYLHVFDWPADGRLRVDGLHNTVKRASLLTAPSAALNVEKGESGALRIALPAKAPNALDTVVVLEIEGRPQVDPFLIRQEPGGSLRLDFASAATFGNAVKRHNRKGEEAQFHISKMRTPADGIAWHVRIERPGAYDVRITYAASPGWEDGRYVVETGEQRVASAVRTRPGWYDSQTETIGRLNLEKSADAVFRLRPDLALDHHLMYFQALELVPAGPKR
jgi:alpha-L-fucosidase